MDLNPAIFFVIARLKRPIVYYCRYILLCQDISTNNLIFLNFMDWVRIIDKAEELIAQKGSNKADLPKILGVRPQYLSDIRSGKSKNPGSEFALALINKIGINPEWLETGQGTPFIRQSIGASAGFVPPGQSGSGGGANSQALANLDAANTPAPEHCRVPILRQKVACGTGVNWEAEENIEEYIEVDMLIPHLGIGRVFAVKAEGSSMLGAGIRAGDYIFFDGTDEQAARDGIYVFALDGDVYCKRLEFDKLAQKIKIFSVRVPELEKAELVVTLDINDTAFADRFRIFGRVVRCIRLIDIEEN
jgi:SOS-response transcriptional repressor LexA